MKQLKLTLMLTVLICMVGAKAYAYENYDIAVENADGVTIYYKYINDGKELEVTFREVDVKYQIYYNYDGLSIIVIPEEVTYLNRTYKVTSIGGYAFRECSALTSVTIPNSVTSIGYGAFWACYGLTSVNIPNSVKSIGESAFQGCSGLTSVTIGNSVTSIGKSAFQGCSGLTSVNIPNSVTSIGESAFENCSGLTSLNIPNSVTSIGKSAFENCSGLTSVNIGKGVTNIGVQAFENCSSLTIVKLYCKKIGNTFSGNRSIKEIIIGDEVIEIENGAFLGCSGLTSVNIPNSVTSIGDKAFEYCSCLTSVTIPNNVTSIGNEAFQGCSGLTSVTIPNSVTSIGESAYQGCSGLMSVNIGNSVTSIGKSAFYDCSGLKKVIVSDIAAWCGIIFGDSHANPLSYAKHLYSAEDTEIQDLNIPNSVTSIGEFAFYNCSGLTSITIPNSVTSIGGSAFENCSGLTSVNIPNSVTSIGGHAFENCSSLTSVNIGKGVTVIGFQAFKGCSALTSVNIPNSVTSIEKSAFSNCSSLTIVELHCKKIGNTFSGNKSIKEIIIGDEVIEIEKGAFKYCSGLTSVTIPNSVTTIGDEAFYECYGIKKIIVGTGIKKCGNLVFSNVHPYKVMWLSSMQPQIKGNVNINCQIYPHLNERFEVDDITYVPVDPSKRTCHAIDYIKEKSGDELKLEKSVSYRGIDFTIEEWYGTFIGNRDIKAINIDCNGIIGDFMCYGCRALEEVKLGNSIKEIGTSAFQECSFQKIEIPNSVTSIGSSSFRYCNNLTTIIIPNSVTSIGNYAFASCSNMTSFDIPNSVTSIGNYAFSNCYNLTSFVIPYSVTSIGNNTFENCEGLTSIIIPDNVTIIGASAFSKCIGLNSINIGKGVTSIGDKAFYGCSNLTSIELNCKYINSSWFSYNKTIKRVIIGDNTVDIRESAFSGCTNIKLLKIGNGIETIKNKSFEDCSSLETCDIGPEIKSIGEKAFNGCKGLRRLICRAVTPPSCGTSALLDIDKWECMLSVPDGATSFYQQTDQWKDFYFINNDLTLIIPAVHKLTYVLDGVEYKTYELEEGEAIVPEPDPTKEGYNFSGWSEIPETMPSHDVTVTGTFTIVDPVTVTAKSYTREYGEANPTFEYTSEGATLNGTPKITCKATTTSPIGEYDIVITKGSVTNYNDHYVNGKLTITKAPLTITAKSYTIKQGEVLPTFDAEYSGFKNNETEAVLITKPTLATTATSASEPGTYEIIVGGAEAQNYESSYTNGKLIITEADPVTITAKSYSREYGEANPTFEFTSEGATLVGVPEITCEATATSPVGTYPIVIEKGTVTNYNDTYINGTLTITKAPLTVKVENVTREQYLENPEFVIIYTGWKLNDDENVLTKKPTATTTATKESPVGEYEIVVSGGEAKNYELSYENGILTVTESTGIATISVTHPVNVYNVQGRMVRSKATTLDGLPKGVYIVNGRKVIVR